MSLTKKILITTLVAVLALVAISFALAYLHQTQDWSGSIMMFDDDLSDSAIGWMIAIPILVLTILLVVLVMVGVGVILAAVVAVLVVMSLLAALFGVLMAIIPFAVFLAVPVLIVWGIVKLANRKPAPTAASIVV